MARKINEELIECLTHGNLQQLLKYIKTEPRNLRLEVRQAGKAFVYYKRGKILELGLNYFDIDGKYFENNQKPEDIEFKVINNPEQYFKDTCPVMEKWLKEHGKKEFETQQNIACENQEKDDRFIILDMEYNFSQSDVKKDERVKKAGFDLLGIERLTGKIILFEVKTGLNALRREAGISTHIKDFEEFILYSKYKNEFRNNLIIDIQNIVSDKRKLGLIDNFTLPLPFSPKGFDLIFVFETVFSDKDDYKKIFQEEYKKSGSIRRYETIYLSKINYKLK